MEERDNTMEIKDIINHIKENPKALEELNKEISLEDFATKAVLDNRDKALKSNQNYKTKNDELTAALEATKVVTPTAIVKETKEDKSPKGITPEVLARLEKLEKLNDEKDVIIASNTIVEARDAALNTIPFKTGGMNIAQTLIGYGKFNIELDGSVRHKENGMSIKDYITQEWSKSPEAILLTDATKSGGAGSKNRTSVPSATKRFSEMSVDEKNTYALENGVEKYNSLKSRG